MKGRTRAYYRTKRMMERNLAVWPIQMEIQAYAAENRVIELVSEENYVRLKRVEPADTYLRLQYWLDIERAHEGFIII